MVTCLALAIVRVPSPIVSFVRVEPAPIYDPLAILIGATSRVPEPINELLSITVLCFFSPS